MAMLDNNDGEENVHKGIEWEIVALTESVYAAAPGPEPDILLNSQTNLTGGDNTETACAMFVSGHFEYSPSTHESLPLEPECKEKYCGKGSDPEFKHEENLNIKGLLSDEYVGVPQYDEKGDSMSFYGSDLGDIASSNLTEKEQSLYSTGKFGSCDDEAVAGMSDKAGEGTSIDEPLESLGHAGNPGVPKIEEDKLNELPNLPCEAWWRMRVASLYCRAKNANPFWSIVLAAAVVGLVIIGHRWQRDKPEAFQVKSQLVIDNEGSRLILGPMA